MATRTTSATRTILWLLGDQRIAASPSPILHDAVFGPGTYLLHPDDDVDRACAAAEAVCRGVNVTAPHKVAVARRYAAVLDERARLTGACNTVVYGDDGKATVAANTDVHGLLTAWRRGGLLVEGRAVAVVGAGGAARAVVVAAAEAGAREVVVHARHRPAAASLVTLAATVGLDATVADAVGSGPRAEVVVCAATDLDDVGGWLDRALKPGGAVHELRYGARARATRDAALFRRALFVDGSSMLLAQAEEAAGLFLGRALDVDQRRTMGGVLASWLRHAR